MSKTFSKIVGTSCAIAGLYAGISYLTFREVFYRDAPVLPMISKITNKKMAKDAPPAAPDEREVWFGNQSFEEYTLQDSNGNNLRGYLLRAEQPSDVYVFGSHGYRSSGKGEFSLMTKFHHDAGRNVFIVDHQASGESEGKYIGFGYYEYRACMKWLSFMLDTFGNDIQIILHGVSMGCATVMLMCGDDALPSNVKFAIADCGYTSAYNEFDYILKKAHIPSFPLVNGANFFNKKINGFDLNDINPIDSVKNAKIPMLFIHGKIDTFVPTHMSKELYNICSSEYKDLLLVDDAWHAQSYPKDPAAYEEKVNNFVEKFIDKKQADDVYA